MNASGAPLQLVDSLNDWAHGTAIEASAAWPSASGFGSYLDALHALPPGVAPRAAPPTVDAIGVSGVGAHVASVSATVAPGSDGCGMVDRIRHDDGLRPDVGSRRRSPLEPRDVP